MKITGNIENNSIVVIVNMKKRFQVIKEKNYINVTMLNASHSVWRSSGKSFSSFEEAIDSYKSAAAKAAIEYAKELLC